MIIVKIEEKGTGDFYWTSFKNYAYFDETRFSDFSVFYNSTSLSSSCIVFFKVAKKRHRLYGFASIGVHKYWYCNDKLLGKFKKDLEYWV